MSEETKAEIRSWGDACFGAAKWMGYALVAVVLVRVAGITALTGDIPDKALFFILVNCALGAALKWAARSR